MKKRTASYHLAIILAVSLLTNSVQAQLAYPPEPQKWDADLLGNHRAVLHINTDQKEVQVDIPWRNRWVEANQQVIIVDSANNKQIAPSAYLWMNTESGGLRFKPVSGKGIYYVYYLPYQMGGRSRNYPDAIYLKNPVSAPKKRTQHVSGNSKGVTVARFDAVDQYNSNDPMEVIARAEEVRSFLSRNANSAYYLFPELREFPIKMESNLPKRWVEKEKALNTLKGIGQSGEFYAFQLGLWSPKKELNDIQISFSDFKANDGAIIPANSMNCINTQGTDYTGKPMSLKVNVPKDRVQALWCGIQIPADATRGTYYGIVTVKPKNSAAKQVHIELTVSNTPGDVASVDQPWKMTRLPWLNSTLAQKNTVIAPYTAIELKADSTLHILGREVKLHPSGFPKQISTFFTPELTEIGAKANDLLFEPIHFHFYQASDGKEIQLKAGGVQFQTKSEGEYSWLAKSESAELRMEVEGKLEFDGYMHYVVKLTALNDLSLKDATMHIPMIPNKTDYFMGLGQKGGKRPEQLSWKWDVAHKNQDGGWIGAVDAGLQFSLRDEHYSRPLNTNFYLQKPLVLPQSWGNENKGGIDIGLKGKSVLVNSYSGARELKEGDVLYYNFNLLITPFHPINTEAQWNERYYHAYKPVDSVVASGSNVINIHHGNEINPYINYPFIATKEMKQYIDQAHDKGLKVKIYNTVREVSNRVYELYPLRSLGTEVFSPGKGVGYSWLQEHVGKNYIAAWYVPQFKDAAIINSGMNRWHNYYVEGMNWLVDHIGIDGIYLDDVAFDRVTMKRIKRVLTKNGKPGLIDLHSANQYNKSDGFNNSANLYLEHFPYINRLWFGEYFDYENNQPDFFLTEVSGIPFGLMGEMLQDGGNPWRGMLYGMTNRMPYQKLTPADLWTAWDQFGIKGSKMIGYWSPNIPVKTDNDQVLTTVYSRAGKAMIAIASWAERDVAVKLTIDWDKLGIDPEKAKLSTPTIPNFQNGAQYKFGDAIPVEKNKGLLLMIE
ncbi:MULTISPECIES: glycoside hydrolase domain-containing protein [unclassified Sphingobacterium]|uniref:glycoside hydrolase domain-containing protein n=1 Tax=unclassified Sphingobacterium TaxID=2609468 RepID=UPI0025F5F504|nr:glycoside hydrolase domain-containing protein [Sphingobacterium sp. UBA5670]